MGDNTHKFQKLTPINDVELGIYEDAISFVFDNDDLKNIAISGQYSAGKSSLVESYKKKYQKLKFVHISLAHFRAENKNNSSESDSSINEITLEGKILNQLIHQISAEDIPQTNFKVKKKIKTESIIISTVLIVLFIATILHMTFFQKWTEFVSFLSDSILKNYLILSTKHDALLFSGFVCAALSCIFIYFLIKIQKNRNMLKKINLQGNEIDIFEESDDSYFDRYLNEVLYLFENVNADAIVFEDMDRFNVNNIFERLHEVNRLVNIQRQLVGNSCLSSENKKPILRFIYLIRDDIFFSKDRTKFFDYIIPVIPVVDSSNSYNQFISHFDKGGILQLFNERFLQGLSLYIDDMRILKNIYNEFLIYFNRLNTTELDCDKMLAIIAYKNIFPRDFSELQLNQGMVFTIFSEKESITNEEMKLLEKKISDKISMINRVNSETLNSNEEIDIVCNKKIARFHQYNHQAEREEVEKERISRKESIDIKSNNRLDIINKELSKLKEELIHVKSKKFKEIITRENIDKIFKVTYTNEVGEINDFKEIKSSEYFDLLKYLIRDGYIDETYTDYMTYFYENSLSRIDKVFLRSITDQKAKEYTYELKNPALVVIRLREIDFEYEETLNFDLLAYLLQTSIHLNLIKRLFKQLRESRCFEFISLYFDTNRAQPNFINKLNTLWPEFFSYALKDDDISSDWTKRYSIGTLHYSTNNTIEAINIDDCLTKYISDSADYLSISEPKIEKLINGFELLNVYFANINFESANKELFTAIYNHSLYEINVNNLSLMLGEIYQLKNKNDIRHKNYTSVMSQPNSPLANYINAHIRDYIDVVLFSCNDLIIDDEPIVLSILNHKEITDEQKNSYMDFLQTSVTSISEIESQNLWLSLLDKDIAVCSEANILSYFIVIETLDSSLIEFINRSETELDFSKITITQEQINKLFNAFIACNGLSDNKYKSLICSFEIAYDRFNFTNISDAKFKILVDESIIHMSLISLSFIRENYPALTFYYIKRNITDYVGIMTTEDSIFEEIMEVISWEVDDKVKLDLLGFIETPLTISDKNYPLAINEYILHNNFELSELLILTSSYGKWDISIQKIILSLAIHYISKLILNPENVPEQLLRDMFSSDVMDINEKIDLLIASLPDPGLTRIGCKEYLDIIGLLEFSKILWRGKPKIEVDVKNEQLLVAFRNNNLLSDFKVDDDKPGYYIITKRLGW